MLQEEGRGQDGVGKLAVFENGAAVEPEELLFLLGRSSLYSGLDCSKEAM